MTYTKSQLTTTPLRLPITATINNGVIMATDGTNSVEVTYTGERPISGTIKIDGFGGLSASDVKYSDNYTCTKGNGESGCTNRILTLPGMTADNMITGRYYFKGANPNNCIYLKEEGDTGASCNYRIVSIEADGTIKVIKADVIRNNDETVKYMPYDSRTTETTGQRLNINNTYCQLHSDGKYYGCNAWNKVNGIYTNWNKNGTVSDDSEINAYLNTTYYNLLDQNVRDNIVTHSFTLVSAFSNGGNGTGISVGDLKTHMATEPNWVGKIGLLELRDWFNAALTCNPEISGGYSNSTNPPENYACSQNNYLYLTGDNKASWWLITPYRNNCKDIFRVDSTGFAYECNASNTSIGIRPVFYLSSNTQLTGSGTTGDPYKIKS